MFLELIATIAAGAGAAGVALVLNRVSGGRLPRWTAPVAAGLAMIAVAIANESTWGARTANGLPDGLVVIETVETSDWYRPWTYVRPQTVRLVALDTTSLQTKADAPGLRLADLYLFARWRPSARVPQILDCEHGRRADVSAAALADPESANWREASRTLIAEACLKDGGESG